MIFLTIAEITLTATMSVTPNASTYTVYEIVQDEAIQVATGVTPTLTFVKPDGYEHGAFVATASNAAGPSPYSAPVYWSAPQNPTEILLRPGTPVIITISHD